MVRNTITRLANSIMISIAILFFVSGCGYTTRSLLPPEYKTVYVENFVNKIQVVEETNDARMYRGYVPGMEITLTKAVINKFLFDGNLTIAGPDKANLILEGEMTDFRREPLRYDNNDNIEEYRIKIFVNMSLKDAKTGKTLWTEDSFSGESTYRTGGSLATTENAAIQDAMDDLARRIVERTVEAW